MIILLNTLFYTNTFARLQKFIIGHHPLTKFSSCSSSEEQWTRQFSTQSFCFLSDNFLMLAYFPSKSVLSNFCSTSDNRYLNMERLHDIETTPALESSRPGPKSSRMLWARAGYLTSSCSIFKWVQLYCKRDTIMYVATGGAVGKEPTG